MRYLLDTGILARLPHRVDPLHTEVCQAVRELATGGHTLVTAKKLVLEQKVEGKQVHDARLAALMGAYRIRRIVTLNAADVGRYKGIEAVTPAEVLGRLPLT